MIKIAVIVILPTFLENFVKFHIKTSQFSLKNQKLNLGQIFFAHLKFSIFGYFSCHNGSKNALISGHSTSFGISSNSLSQLGHKKIAKKFLLNTWLVSVEHSMLILSPFVPLRVAKASCFMDNYVPNALEI